MFCGAPSSRFSWSSFRTSLFGAPSSRFFIIPCRNDRSRPAWTGCSAGFFRSLFPLSLQLATCVPEFSSYRDENSQVSLCFPLGVPRDREDGTLSRPPLSPPCYPRAYARPNEPGTAQMSPEWARNGRNEPENPQTTGNIGGFTLSGTLPEPILSPSWAHLSPKWAHMSLNEPRMARNEPGMAQMSPEWAQKYPEWALLEPTWARKPRGYTRQKPVSRFRQKWPKASYQRPLRSQKWPKSVILHCFSAISTPVHGKDLLSARPGLLVKPSCSSSEQERTRQTSLTSVGSFPSQRPLSHRFDQK